ncbi:glycosyltransferase [Autumnicola psychrophila]|uniref:Glycosyltransferase n=1 Tax=Autumnicola psychrophila TaxID=3075592 RepID=A0ABU3DNG7_9FLAO|nr:glycosyltransferase [Zunongwangia sp. F225]MDT0685256.1 glycosyltransferase [Zunongwangia sp. F225]
MRRLYYFTDSFPFSVDYTWKSAEVNEASKKFDEVIIVPFTYTKENKFSFAKNVHIVEPTLGKTLFAKPQYLKHLIASTQPKPWFREFFRAITKGKQAIIDWYLATIYSDIIVKKDIFKQLEKEKDQQEYSVLFFQWTMNNALLVPLLRKWGYQNIICRMHGFDLYEFRHNNYIPYKADLLKNASICTFISEHGRDYATQLYPFIKSKSKLHYLGAKEMGENILDPDQKFHIVSVSRAVPLKRLGLIVEALKLLKRPVKWTHIGDGYALEEVRKSAQEIEKFNVYCEVKFLGWLNPEAIRSYFSENGINALILVSETEGLPVVIMEAFSASIPVIATDVGGVSELVNAENGILLTSNPEASEVADAIELLVDEPIEVQDTRRKTAFQSYSASFDLKKNSKEFIGFLSEQCH